MRTKFTWLADSASLSIVRQIEDQNYGLAFRSQYEGRMELPHDNISFFFYLLARLLVILAIILCSLLCMLTRMVTSLSCHTWHLIIKALKSKVRWTLCAFNFNTVLSEYIYFLGSVVQAEHTAICVQAQTANIFARLFTFETGRLPLETEMFHCSCDVL
jgi:hypothetical protein